MRYLIESTVAPFSLVTAVCWLLLTVVFSAPPSRAGGSGEEPVKVTVCQLKDDPAAYNRKLVEVTGLISHGFEEFTLFDPGCSSWPGIWLEYGGVASSGTIYCCGVTSSRRRPKQLVVENIPITLVDDGRFREFDKLLQHKPDSVVHATVVGRFFSGEQLNTPGGVLWGGYGHLGCCSLLAIQQVISVDPQDRKDLDYGASADHPGDNEVKSTVTYLVSTRPYTDMIEAQRKAEMGQREWAFSDPRRVATDALAMALGIDEKSIIGMRQTRKAQGRIIYRWRSKAGGMKYMVVVSRPYWLSFYAKDSKRVAWVVTAAYEIS